MRNDKGLIKYILSKFNFGKFGQVNPATTLIISLAIVLLFSLLIFFFNIELENFFIIFLALAVLLVTLINTNASLIILIFSMLLSPQLATGSTAGARAIVIRVDDVVLLVICFTWLVKMAINKNIAFLKFTPLNLPLLIYIAVCIISTLFNLIGGEISLKKSLFVIVKYFEYFLLYFMVVNNVSSFKQIKQFTMCLIIVCVLVSFTTYSHIARGEKTTAPFQAATGEPNTLAGYQILLIAVSAGLFLYAKAGFWRLATAGLIFFTMPSFIYTQSRGGYIGFIFMYLGLIIFTKKKKALLFLLLICTIFIIPLIIPDVIVKRVSDTFELPGKDYQFLGMSIHLDDSAAARIEGLRYVFEKLQKNPLLGIGVGSVELIDTQVGRVLGETGILGLIIFSWLIATIFKTSLETLQIVNDDWSQGLIVGFLAGLVGLIFHSFSAETFIIVRIMEPFWFIAALINRLPETLLLRDQTA
jgi:hypothetical protein